MAFYFGLKRICDVLFYLTFATLFGAIFNTESIIIALPFFALASFMGASLVKWKVLKYISIMPLFLMFLIIPVTFLNLIILVPAIIFMTVSIPSDGERANQFNYAETFQIFLGLFLFFYLLLSLLGMSEFVAIPFDFLFFALTFLITAIMFMRMSRHDEAVLRQRKFKILNSLPFLSIMVITLVISSDFIMTKLGLLLRLFLNLVAAIILPILEFLIFIIFIPIGFIMRILGFGSPAIDLSAYTPSLQQGIDGIYENSGNPQEMHPIIPLIAFIIVFLVIAGLFYWMLSQKKSLYLAGGEIDEVRISLDDGLARKSRNRKRSVENQIRETYRKFLVLIQKKNIKVLNHDTSADVENKIFENYDSKLSSRIRDLYIMVRYGGKEITKEDVRNVKTLYSELKNEIEGK